MSDRKASFVGLISLFVTGVALGAIPNWPAPAAWSPPRAQGVTTLSETNPLPFIAVSPCRVADTRGNGFTGQYGPPSLAANGTRSFTILGQCGIPGTAAAVSFNFGALNVGAGGDLRVFPAGGSVPLVSTLNYNANTPNIANAAVVEIGTGGAITVQADAISIDLIIDVNGYYYSGNAGPLTGGENFFIRGTPPVGVAVIGGLNSSTTGDAYGISGQSMSTSGIPAGVIGVDYSFGPVINASAPTNLPSGVFGASDSKVGVEGDSRNVGVRGRLLDTAGNVVHVGLLGFSTYGVFSTGDYGGTGAKYFVEPHATDPSKVIRFVALEGNEAGTYFRGTAQVVGGRAVISVPEEFRMVTDEEGLTVQLTPVGPLTTMSVESEDLNSIVVRSSRDVTFHYLVQGVRRAYKDYASIVEGQEFMPYSPSAAPLTSYPAEIQQRLVANGTYNPDGSINASTAARLGWTKSGSARVPEGQPVTKDPTAGRRD